MGSLQSAPSGVLDQQAKESLPNPQTKKSEKTSVSGDSTHLEIFVPGRICLLGEHSDWAGTYRKQDPTIEKGYALVCGTDQGLYSRATAHSERFRMSSEVGDHKEHSLDVPMELDELKKLAQGGGFWSYACGVAYVVKQQYETVGGASIINYKTDLPVKKGLSSSAALCVSVVRAFSRLYNLNLSVEEEMELAYRGEILTGSQCGRLDQCCAYGQKVVLVTFDKDRIVPRVLHLKHPLYMLIVDLHSEKNTKLILQKLHECFPSPQNSIHEGVHRLLGQINKDLVHKAADELESDDSALCERIGEMMCEYQRHFDDLAKPQCPEELSSPVLHKMLSYLEIQPFVCGGKGVGSQGDGSGQLVLRNKYDQENVARILEEELKLSCLKLTIGPRL